MRHSSRESIPTISTGSHSIHDHAFDPRPAAPLEPGWHAWQATPLRQPGIVQDGGWDRLVDRAGGDVTQTRGWMQYALRTGYQRAFLIAGIGDAGAPDAIAVGYVSESRWTALGLRSIRFPAYPTAGEDLTRVAEAIRVCEQVGRALPCLSIEFLSGGQPRALAALRLPDYRTQEKLEYVIGLAGTRDELWTKLHRDQRRNVRFSERMNVTVKRMESLEAVRSLREIQLEVTRRHAAKGDFYGIRSLTAYDTLHEALITRGLARLYCGVVEDKIVMAALCSTYQGRARGIYNGATRRGLEVRASTAVIWRIIEELSLEGFKELSLGIAEESVEDPSSPAHGLHEFKLDLGAEARRVPFVSKELNPRAAAAQRVLRSAASAVRRVRRRR
jgi:hypothetical protein